MTDPRYPGPQPQWVQAPDGRWYPGQPPRPPQRSGNGCVTALAVVGGAVVLIVVAVVAITLLGASSKTNVATNPNAQPNAALTTTSRPAVEGVSTTTERPGTTRQSPAPVGTAVVAAKGWAVTVVSSEPNANALLAAANQFNRPDAGKQYVMVKVTLQLDHTGKPATVFTEVKLALLTASGVASNPTFAAGTPDELDQFAQLQPGATITGNLVFEVSAAEVAGSMLLAQPQFTVDKNEDQRFLALG